MRTHTFSVVQLYLVVPNCTWFQSKSS